MRTSVVFLSPLHIPAYTYTTIKRAGPALGGKQHNKRGPFVDASPRLAAGKQRVIYKTLARPALESQRTDQTDTLSVQPTIVRF
jgi:hypothetical protein